MFLVILINAIIWGAVIFFLFEGKKVRYEMSGGNGKIIMILFFLLGLIQYIAHTDFISTLTFISLVLSGIVYSLVPSGICKEGLMIIGLLYPYGKISNIEYVIEHERLEVSFVYKHRTYFLFKEKEYEDEVRREIKKYQGGK